MTLRFIYKTKQNKSLIYKELHLNFRLFSIKSIFIFCILLAGRGGGAFLFPEIRYFYSYSYSYYLLPELSLAKFFWSSRMYWPLLKMTFTLLFYEADTTSCKSGLRQSVPPIWSDQLFRWAVFSYICPGTVQCTVYIVYTHQSVPFLNSVVKTQPQVRPV